MKTAFILFDQMTALDFIGAYDALTRLKSMGISPDFQWDLCAFTPDIFDDKGLRLTPGHLAPALAEYDLLVVPGGFGTRALQYETPFLEWLQSAAPVPLKASVCTGSLLLGAAGFLKGKPATTHPQAMEELKQYCERVLPDRIVDTGKIVTSRGVTASIDLGLYLVDRLAGPEARRRIAKQMDYPYYFDITGQ